MASAPETAAQAALLSAALSASNDETVKKSLDLKSEPKLESLASDSTHSFSPIKSESAAEPKEEIAATTTTEESDAEAKYTPNKVGSDVCSSDESKAENLRDEFKDDPELKGIDWRPLRSRSFLTDAQVQILSQQFKRNPFPSKYELSALAEQIGVNKRVVQVGGQRSILFAYSK